MKLIKHISSVKNPLIKPCPCAKGHRSCGYIVISQIINCPYNCSYCYLQTFYGKDEIVVVTDEDKILRETKEYMDASDHPLRIGTGEFSDSLAIPEAVSLAKKLVKLFSEQDKHLLELKTKSTNVDQLLDLDHKGRTVVGWSLNPESIAKTEEPDAPSLKERLMAAKRCAEAGYFISFHFDPIIAGNGREYEGVVGEIREYVDPRQIAWISLGALRFPAKQKEVIQKKHNNSRIDFSQMIQGKDNKLRYPSEVRKELFANLRAAVSKYLSDDIYVYLCMEEDGVEGRGKFAEYFAWS
ncbi:MAG: hypothetical protein HQ564_08390 [Candidatus Saganbacteria bacterium]|nr:hypothetical protein [Candidatus Saganbacteria bacterium]